MYSKDTNEERAMDSKTDNINIMIKVKVDKVFEKIF